MSDPRQPPVDASVAQSAARQSHNEKLTRSDLKVVSSSLTRGTFFTSSPCIKLEELNVQKIIPRAGFEPAT